MTETTSLNMAALLQRCDGLQRLLLSSQVPIFEQLLSVRRSPLHDEPQGARRQVPFKDRQRVYRYDGLLLSVTNVKVRRRMVVVVQ